jgi:hypothetical protein
MTGESKEELRKHLRKDLESLPLAMVDGMGKVVNFLPIDISEFGIGFLAKVLILPGATLTLKSEEHSVEVEVVWRLAGGWTSKYNLQDLDYGNIFRYGGKSRDKSDSLQNFLKSISAF